MEFDVNNLRIAAPCPMSWNEMTGDHRTRHCDLCELNVHNVAGMTRDEVAHLVGQSNGRLCMRLVRRADGTVMTKDCPVGRRAYRKRAASIAGAALAAVFGLFSVSFGQKEESSFVRADASIFKTIISSKASKGASFRGTAMDPNGAIIPAVQIELYLDGKAVAWTRSDNDGLFEFPELRAGIYEARISNSAGFRPLLVQNLELRDGQEKTISIYLDIDPDSVTIGVIAAGVSVEFFEPPQRVKFESVEPRPAIPLITNKPKRH